MAWYCKKKGKDDYVVAAINQFLSSLGHVKITLQGDQGPALMALLERVKSQRQQPTLLRAAPVESKGSDGA
eukprot:15480256-Alexandrium_andersonii.AAC.1